jgi:hypothetical protein
MKSSIIIVLLIISSASALQMITYVVSHDMKIIYPQSVNYCSNTIDCSNILFAKQNYNGFPVAYFPTPTNCTHDISINLSQGLLGLSYEGINNHNFVVDGSTGTCDRTNLCIYDVCKASNIPTVKFVRLDLL